MVVHIAVMITGWCSLLCAAWNLFYLRVCLEPRDIVRYHLIGPPDQLFAVRWAPPLLCASVLCALCAIILALWGAARWSSLRASARGHGER